MISVSVSVGGYRPKSNKKDQQNNPVTTKQPVMIRVSESAEVADLLQKPKTNKKTNQKQKNLFPSPPALCPRAWIGASLQTTSPCFTSPSPPQQSGCLLPLVLTRPPPHHPHSPLIDALRSRLDTLIHTFHSITVPTSPLCLRPCPRQRSSPTRHPTQIAAASLSSARHFTTHFHSLIILPLSPQTHVSHITPTAHCSLCPRARLVTLLQTTVM